MKKRTLPILFVLLALGFSACSGMAVEPPKLEFEEVDGGVSVLRLSFDGENPVLLENGATDDHAGTVTLMPPYSHVFDLEPLAGDGADAVYALPYAYKTRRDQSNVEGILIYCEYAYMVVRDADGQQLYPLSPGAPALFWSDFYSAALTRAKESSALSGIENYGL